MHSFRPSSSLLLFALTLGCADAEPPDGLELEVVDRVLGDCRGCVWGPPVLNTAEANGFSTPEINIASLTSGVGTEKVDLLSVSVGVDPYQEDLVDLWVADGVLFGTGVSGTPYEGSDFVGSQWALSDNRNGGSPIPTTMRVVDFVEDGPRSRYTFTYSSIFTEWLEVPLCALDDETFEETAIVFPDLHVDDAGTMSAQAGSLLFGCVSGAVGKAAMWGYSPADFGPDGHQAATRAVMADYCGDGTSWTATGTPLQVEDVAGIRAFAAGHLDTEALWTSAGAHCVRTPRLLGTWSYGDISCADHTIPECDPETSLGDVPGALLWTKVWEPI